MEIEVIPLLLKLYSYSSDSFAKVADIKERFSQTSEDK